MGIYKPFKKTNVHITQTGAPTCPNLLDLSGVVPPSRSRRDPFSASHLCEAQRPCGRWAQISCRGLSTVIGARWGQGHQGTCQVYLCWLKSNRSFNGLVSGKILTGNHRFSHWIWGFPVNFPLIQSIDSWLVVTGTMEFGLTFQKQLGMEHHPNWRTHQPSFFRGVAKNHQPDRISHHIMWTSFRISCYSISHSSLDQCKCDIFFLKKYVMWYTIILYINHLNH